MEILRLGDPRLRQVGEPVADVHDPAVVADGERLMQALADFRAAHGFGRAIAAPQIGVFRRMIAVNFGAGPFVICNPVLREKSEETMTVWDDCMSFPGIMVRVRRHRHITLDFELLADGSKHTFAHINEAASELIQHEYDHLDGILSVDRAETDGGAVRDAVIDAEQYRRAPDSFNSLVDYAIAPTIGASLTMAEGFA